MTKDRARKQAARERAAATGERYVVARRQAVEPPSPDGGVLHELTHRVPGVPVHVEGGFRRAHDVAVARTGDGTRARSAESRPAETRQPRVLVGWQNRIARLFSVK